MLSRQNNRQILTRVLTNVCEIYRTGADSARATSAIDRMILLNRDSAALYRDRAGLLGERGVYGRALQDLERVRRLQPAARRSTRFRGWLRFVRDMAARMN